MAIWIPKVDGVDRIRAAHINDLQTLKTDIVKAAEAALGLLDDSELGFATDTYRIYIGSPVGNLPVYARDYVTPEMYGAIGDGVINDTVAIHAMFTALPATNPPTVRLSNIYLVDDSVSWDIIGISDLLVLGPGGFKANHPDGTIVHIENCPRIRFDGVKINGNSKGEYGFNIRTSPDFRFHNCWVYDLDGGAGQANGFYIAPGCHRGVISKCYVANLKGTISVRAVNVNNFIDGASLSSDIIITENIFIGSTDDDDADAIVFDQAGKSSYGIVTKNRFIDWNKRACKFITDQIICQGNQITRTLATVGFAHISAYGNDILVEGNKAVSSTGYVTNLLSAQPFANISFINNEMVNPAAAATHGCHGVYLEAGAGTYINTKIVGNIFDYVNYDVWIGKDVTNLEISDNSSNHHDSHIITAFASLTLAGVKIKGNRFWNGSHYFLSIPSTCTLSDWTIEGNIGDAAWGFSYPTLPRQTDIAIAKNMINGTLSAGYWSEVEIGGNVAAFHKTASPTTGIAPQSFWTIIRATSVSGVSPVQQTG